MSHRTNADRRRAIIIQFRTVPVKAHLRSPANPPRPARTHHQQPIDITCLFEKCRQLLAADPAAVRLIEQLIDDLIATAKGQGRATASVAPLSPEQIVGEQLAAKVRQLAVVRPGIAREIDLMVDKFLAEQPAARIDAHVAGVVDSPAVLKRQKRQRMFLRLVRQLRQLETRDPRELAVVLELVELKLARQTKAGSPQS
jgi:hypothetical protein